MEYQFFCDIYLGTGRLSNYKIISEIRCELSNNFSIEGIQSVLYKYWSAYIQDKHSITMDATCYESELRILPTRKLLLGVC